MKQLLSQRLCTRHRNPSFGNPLTERIPRYAESDGLAGVDATRLGRLIERGFGKALAPGYFEMHIDRVIFESGYLGAAVVKKVLDSPYLDKFVVDPTARGAGIGREIWDRLRSNYNALIWRSRIGNPINPWYEKESDQAHHCGQWIVFSYNMGTETASSLIPVVAQLPETLIKTEVYA